MGRFFGDAAVPEGEGWPCPVFTFYTVFRLTAAGKSRKTHSQGSRKVPSKTVLCTIRLIDLAVLRAATISLLTFVTIGPGDSGQPSVSADICRVAELRVPRKR